MSYKTLELLKKFSYLGENRLDNGTMLIGKAPHIAPYAWLHCIYTGLSEEDIVLLENGLGAALPDAYKNFLQITNGLGVFNTTFSLFGLRRNYNRTVEDVWQPFDIITPNVMERPRNAKAHVFIIGNYDWDGSYLYIDTNTGKVHLCKRVNITSLFQWQHFEDMLEKEIPRLITLFDKNGKEINTDRSTLPA